jgi:hypothetical protein
LYRSRDSRVAHDIGQGIGLTIPFIPTAGERFQ